MSHSGPGLLASYNSLQDKNLAGYFSTTRMKKHLVRSGLVSKKGSIVEEKTYRLNVAKKEHGRHVRDHLATAIIQKALDMERLKQFEIRKRLDERNKVELVRRVKDRKRSNGVGESSLQHSRCEAIKTQNNMMPDDRVSSAPAGSTHSFEKSMIQTHYESDPDTGKVHTKHDSIKDLSNANDQSYLREEGDVSGTKCLLKPYQNNFPLAVPLKDKQAYNVNKSEPYKFHYRAKAEPATTHKRQLQSVCEMTMKFVGPSRMQINNLFTEKRLSEVMVLQQHHRGSTLCLFRELLPPNTVFSFTSKRYRGTPLGVTFYIDGMQHVRLSTCCEYKHKPGCILGGKNGHFQFIQVEGAAPCYRCQASSQISDSEPKSNLAKTRTEPKQNENAKMETIDIVVTGDEAVQ